MLGLVPWHGPLLGDTSLATWVYRPRSQASADTSVWLTHQPIQKQIFTFTDIHDMGSGVEGNVEILLVENGIRYLEGKNR